MHITLNATIVEHDNRLRTLATVQLLRLMANTVEHCGLIDHSNGGLTIVRTVNAGQSVMQLSGEDELV